MALHDPLTASANCLSDEAKLSYRPFDCHSQRHILLSEYISFYDCVRLQESQIAEVDN